MALGLANRVVEPDALMDEALALAETIASKSPLVLRLLKRTIDAGADMPLPAALAHEQAVISLVLDSEDAHEGCRAFLEKRDAPVQGRLSRGGSAHRRAGADAGDGAAHRRRLRSRLLAGARPSRAPTRAGCGRRSATRASAASRCPKNTAAPGSGMLDMALVIEALCESRRGRDACPDLHGEPDLRRRRHRALRARRPCAATLLPPLIAGDIESCMALTEPDAGTNSLELRTFAEAHGNGWRLNGRKIWISAVPTADKMLVVARTKKVEESAAPHRRHLALSHRCGARGADPFRHREGGHPLRAGEQCLF